LPSKADSLGQHGNERGPDKKKRKREEFNQAQLKRLSEVYDMEKSQRPDADQLAKELDPIEGGRHCDVAAVNAFMSNMYQTLERTAGTPGTACRKGQKICSYQFCSSPMHSKKWRTITHGTSTGGRDWDFLVGQLLCDSCFSTYRQHGTFMRSVRTNEGWLRMKSADTSADFSSPQTPSNASQKRQRVHNS
jgi:hypothetical protein